MKQIQTHEMNGVPMPLLMSYTTPAKIQEAENLAPSVYNPITQVVYDMRTVGTKCLRSSSTRKKQPGGSTSSSVDRKNEIDDSKSVK
jgi:hypothetical protein